jgi:S1-C subfamily serine protease
MSCRAHAFFLALFCLSTATAVRAQMTADEALHRLREREAARAAAAATQPAAKSPTLSEEAEAHGPDLSTQVQTLDTFLSDCFHGTISASYLPAQTQQWLNTAASRSSIAASKLLGVEASAKIIIASVTSDDTGIVIQGHLFPVSERSTLTRAGKVQLLPAQGASEAANQRVASLKAQINGLQTQRSHVAFDLASCQAADTDRRDRDQAAIAELDAQMRDLTSLLPDAQRKLDEALAHLRHARQSVLLQQNAGSQVWGPITINTRDSSCLNKLPGNIVTMRLRVASVDVNVTRTPDCAGWEFSSDAANQGQTRMPIASDPTGPGAVAAEIDSTITLTCDDTASYPTPRPPTPRVASSASPTAITASAVQLPTFDRKLPAARGIVSSPHEDAALAAAVGFVVVGIQAVLPNGDVRQRPLVTGSCFAVTPTGFLLTNRHVIEDFDILNDPSIQDDIRARYDVPFQPRTWVFFGTNQCEAQIVYKSLTFDVAVLKVTRPQQVYFRLAAKPAESRGADVFAAGFPGLGSEALGEKELQNEINQVDALNATFDIKSQFKPRDFEYTLTKGAVGRVVHDVNNQCWIQHEALIRHGNSGGPLLNESGIVLGINTWMQHDDEGDVQTNMSEEISQLRRELDAHVPGLVWVAP